MTTMKNGIPSDCYYALLEWKEDNSVKFAAFTEFLDPYNRRYSLNELTPEELKILYRAVFNKDIEN
jgi:hypothetical protein